MKKIIAVALLAAAVSTPTFADHTSPKFPTGKSAAASPSGHKHDHKSPAMKGEDCDVVHGKMDQKGAAATKEEDCDVVHGKSGHPVHGMMGKDECDVAHGAGAHHRYGRMWGQRDDTLMEPDMRMIGALAISEEQQAKITKLGDELKHNNWATQGLINDESAKLRDLYQADKRDPAAIGKEYQKIFDLKRQMIETYLDTQNRIEEILTPEQRAQMKEARRKTHSMYRHTMQ